MVSSLRKGYERSEAVDRSSEATKPVLVETCALLDRLLVMMDPLYDPKRGRPRQNSTSPGATDPSPGSPSSRKILSGRGPGAGRERTATDRPADAYQVQEGVRIEVRAEVGDGQGPETREALLSVYPELLKLIDSMLRAVRVGLPADVLEAALKLQLEVIRCLARHSVQVGAAAAAVVLELSGPLALLRYAVGCGSFGWCCVFR